MNKGLFKIGALMLMVVLVGMVSCGGEAPEQKRQEGRLEKMKPKAEDRLSTLMTRSWDNLTYMMYGFLSYDKVKIKTATANLVAISPYMAQRISPQYQQDSAAWREQCNQLQDTVGNIKQAFLEEDFEASRNHLRNLTAVCMECHKVYRKHLLKPEEEESS